MRSYRCAVLRCARRPADFRRAAELAYGEDDDGREKLAHQITHDGEQQEWLYAHGVKGWFAGGERLKGLVGEHGHDQSANYADQDRKLDAGFP